ncbi:MAG: cupin domain-containing protein [Thermovirgaceae bacterium]|nr:cupin domain-containing protein [Thermovirgaceae bacterium]
MLCKCNEMRAIRRENLQGGPGGAMFFPTIAPGEKPEGSHLKMVARVELDPGAAVGEHKHSGDEEVYFIISGRGLFTEDGVQVKVGPGDTAVTLNGHEHSILNTGDEPLVFLAVIAE